MLKDSATLGMVGCKSITRYFDDFRNCLGKKVLWTTFPEFYC